MTNPDSVAVLREMLPCPFCGEVPTIANIRADENQGTKWGGVVCSCGIVGPEVRTGYEPVAEWADRAAEAWNERTPSAALSAQGEEPATYGIRRNGETAIIDIVPEKIRRLPLTSGEYARDYEEVPLYLHPAPPGSDAVTEALQKCHDALMKFAGDAFGTPPWAALTEALSAAQDALHPHEGGARPMTEGERSLLSLALATGQVSIGVKALAARTGKGEANGR